MKRSTRLLSLVLSIMMVMSILPTYASADYISDCRQGKIDVVVNVYDWDAAVASNGTNKVPLAGVPVEMTRRSQTKSSLYPDKVVASATSDQNGVAHIVLDVTTRTDTKAYLPNGDVIYDPANCYADSIRFDVGPAANSGFNFNISRKGFIRNIILAAYGGYCPCSSELNTRHECTHTNPCTLTTTDRGYNDFVFHGNMRDHGAYIELDIYLHADTATVTYENDGNIKNFDAANFPSETVSCGQCFTAPTATVEHATDSDMQFIGWKNKATGAMFDFSQPAAGSVTLVPAWRNANVAGYIHLDSFLWNHNANTGAYGSGWTNTTVNGLKYIVEYYDQDAGSSSVWNTLCTVTVGGNGQADFVVTADMLAELRAYYDTIAPLGGNHHVVLDIGPDVQAKGWHTADQTAHNYSWDWIRYNQQYSHGAGVTGVRTMMVDETSTNYDLNRNNNDWVRKKGGDETTPRGGNIQYGSNQNHVVWLTEGMLNDGFEFYWTVYVTPSMVVSFDTNGGTGAGDYRDQNFDPINSLPETAQNTEYKVQKPANDPTLTGKTFVGWYKVTGEDTLEGMPWDFANRVVTESMTLKAVYADKQYTVTFDPANGTAAQSAKYVVGGTPAWSGADPVSSDPLYEFDYWKEITGASIGSEYIFKDEYDIDHTAREIYAEASDTPVSVTTGFADITVYQAQYKLKEYFYVVHHAVHGDLDDVTDAIPLSALDDTDGCFDITAPLESGEYAGIREGYIYGGIYKDDKFDAPVEDEEICGMTLEPAKGEFFYLREVSNDFLQPKLISVHRFTNDDHFERYLLTAIDQDGADNEFYSAYGFVYNQDWEAYEGMRPGSIEWDEDEVIYDRIVDDTSIKDVDFADMRCILYEYIHVHKYGVEGYTEYTPASVFSANPNITENDYFGCVPFDSEYAEDGTTEDGFEYSFSYVPYYVTADGVFVSGIKERYVGDLEQLSPDCNDVVIDSVTYNVGQSEVFPENIRSMRPMMVASFFAADPNVDPEPQIPVVPVEPEITEITVTIHANGTASAVTAEPGDFTALVEAPAFSGLRFAGWYADAAFTAAADLSDVNDDTDVYARYISDAYFTVQVINTTSKKVITKTRVVTVIDDRDLYEEVGFEITVGGVKTAYVLTKDYASVNGYSPVKMYGSNVDKHSRLIYQDIDLKTVSDGTMIEMTPYYVTADGTRVLGKTRTVMYYSDHMESIGG